MADTKNIEAPPASEPPAPAQNTPVVVRERGSWVQPLVAGLVVVAALVLGGIGGFALATATHAGGPPALEQVQQGGPQQGQLGGPMQGPGQGGPGMQDGDRPHPPGDQSDDSDGSSDSGDSTEG